MTQNQIAFYKAKEERRHNVRTEAQTDVSLGENIRHNKASESINWYSAKTGAAVGFAQAAAAQAQAAAARKQADVAERKVSYDYALGLKNSNQQYNKILMDNQLGWAKQHEAERHNQQMEFYQQGELIVGGVSGMIGSIGNLASGYAKVHPLLP